MNRLHNAQKQLAESLAALESAVEQTLNLAASAANGSGTGSFDTDKSDAPAHPAPAIDIAQLSQDLTAIEADLETAMKMMANLTVPSLSSGYGEDSL